MDDEVLIDVPDGYRYLPLKTRASHVYAVEHGYDYVFQCFTDTYVNVPNMLQSGFEYYDYVGYIVTNSWGSYIAGGPGYWLSRRACCECLVGKSINHWAEERLGWMDIAEETYIAAFRPSVQRTRSSCSLLRRIEASGLCGGKFEVQSAVMHQYHRIYGGLRDAAGQGEMELLRCRSRSLSGRHIVELVDRWQVSYGHSVEKPDNLSRLRGPGNSTCDDASGWT